MVRATQMPAANRTSSLLNSCPCPRMLSRRCWPPHIARIEYTMRYIVSGEATMTDTVNAWNFVRSCRKMEILAVRRRE